EAGRLQADGGVVGEVPALRLEPADDAGGEDRGGLADGQRRGDEGDEEGDHLRPAEAAEVAGAGGVALAGHHREDLEVAALDRDRGGPLEVGELERAGPPRRRPAGDRRPAEVERGGALGAEGGGDPAGEGDLASASAIDPVDDEREAEG